MPEMAQFLGITLQVVRQRIFEERLEASKVWVKGANREYLMSAEAICDHYGLSNAEENAEMEQWLPVKSPKGLDKGVVYPDPFDFVNQGMDMEPRVVVITNSAEQRQ